MPILKTTKQQPVSDHRTLRCLSLVLASCAIASVAVAQANPDHTRRAAPQFEIEVDHARLPALSQGRAGTCWSYSTTSFLESELLRLHGEATDLSELHTVYFAYLEKARRFVRLHGKAQFSQGGLCHDVVEMIGRHGVVPQSAYAGLVGNAREHDHDELEAVLGSVLESLAERDRLSTHWESAVTGVLSAYLGAPPASIDVEGKSLTPIEYAKHLQIPLGAYRQLMSLQSETMWGRAQLMVPDNWMHHGDYWNVPLEVMLDSLDAALRAGFTAAIDIDVSERGVLGRDVVWKLPDALEREGAIDGAVRQAMFDSRETTDDHLMHIVGIAHDADGRRFYLTKNSHGAGGPLEGHVYVSRNYLAAKLLSFMVHEDGLSRELVERFGG